MIEVNDMMRESAAGQGQRKGDTSSRGMLCRLNGEGSAVRAPGAVSRWSGQA